jgi:four helix bundle protein
VRGAGGVGGGAWGVGRGREEPMNYNDWIKTVPAEITADALWNMQVYRLSLFAVDLGWTDVTHLSRDARTVDLSDQLYRAMGSVSANIAEGYSRQSHKDQARYYEYALGSAREARNWIWLSRHVLSESVTKHRLDLLAQIIRLLLRIIPSQRGYALREVTPEYGPEPIPAELLTNVPT